MESKMLDVSWLDTRGEYIVGAVAMEMAHDQSVRVYLGAVSAKLPVNIAVRELAMHGTKQNVWIGKAIFPRYADRISYN